MGREEEAGPRAVRAARNVRPLNDPRNPTLEQAIANDPFDRETYLVYADWLEGQGDPRAKLIALQCSSQPEDEPVRTLFAEHQRYLLGPLARMSKRLTWRYGFIHAALFDEPDLRPGDVELFLAHPSARFVVEITVSSRSVDDSIVALEQSPPSLRTLALRRWGAGADLLSLAPLARVIPQLHSLTLQGGLAFEPTPLPRLRTLLISRIQNDGRTPGSSATNAIDIACPALTKLALSQNLHIGTIDAPLLESAEIIGEHAVRAINETRWPVLRDLTISDVDPHLLAPFFRRDDMPALTRLQINGATDSVAVCRLLRDAPFARQLKQLMMTSDALDDDGAKVLAGGSFPALEELDVSENVLTWRGFEPLDGMNVPSLVDDRRFGNVGE